MSVHQETDEEMRARWKRDRAVDKAAIASNKAKAKATALAAKAGDSAAAAERAEAAAAKAAEAAANLEKVRIEQAVLAANWKPKEKAKKEKKQTTERKRRPANSSKYQPSLLSFGVRQGYKRSKVMANIFIDQLNTEIAKVAKWISDNAGACDCSDAEQEANRLKQWLSDFTRSFQPVVDKLIEQADVPKATKKSSKSSPVFTRQQQDDRNALRKFDREQQRIERERREKWDTNNLGACDDDEIEEEQARRRQWEDDYRAARQKMIDDARARRKEAHVTKTYKRKATGELAAKCATLWAYHRWLDGTRKSAAIRTGVDPLARYETQGEVVKAKRRWRYDLLQRAKKMSDEKFIYKQDVKNAEQSDEYWHEVVKYIVDLYLKVGENPPLSELQEQIVYV